jgi:thiol-disulfide isomerase/thioredoxin
MQTVSIAIGIVVLIIGIGYFVTNSNNAPGAATQEAEMAAVEHTTPDQETIATDTDLDTENPQTVTTAGTYQPYDAELIAQSDAEHIVLVFHAAWCPSCRALESDITDNLTQIPAGIEIYKADFDTATALKRQHGVTMQHSVLEITSTGESVSSVTHPLTLDDLLATL